MNITLPRAVIEQALEEWHTDPGSVRMASFMIALRTALEQPDPEPVAWMLKTGHGTEFKEQLTDELKALTWKGKPMWMPLYTSPPQRKPLTEEMVTAAARELCKIHAGECQVDEQDTWDIYCNQFKRDARCALEAALGIKGES